MNKQLKISLKSIFVKLTEFLFHRGQTILNQNDKLDSNKRFAGRAFANALSSFFRFAIEFVSVVGSFFGRMFCQIFQNLLVVLLILISWNSHVQDAVKSIHFFPENFPENFRTKSKLIFYQNHGQTITTVYLNLFRKDSIG